MRAGASEHQNKKAAMRGGFEVRRDVLAPEPSGPHASQPAR